MIISIIAAIGKQRQLGLNNQIPWHVPEDLKMFKRKTMNHHLIMGRKTFDSIERHLPGRTIHVLSSRLVSTSKNRVFTKLNDALEHVRSTDEKEVFITGGASVYKEALSITNRIYLSKVDYTGDADCFFPPYELSKFKLKSNQHYPKKDKTPSWDFEMWESKQI